MVLLRIMIGGMFLTFHKYCYCLLKNLRKNVIVYFWRLRKRIPHLRHVKWIFCYVTRTIYLSWSNQKLLSQIKLFWQNVKNIDRVFYKKWSGCNCLLLTHFLIRIRRVTEYYIYVMLNEYSITLLGQSNCSGQPKNIIQKMIYFS